MERIYQTLSFGTEMHWHCEDNGHICSSYLPESFVMRCFGSVRTIPNHRHRDLQIRHLIWLLLLQRMSSFFTTLIIA